MLKKIMSVLLVLLLTFGMTACGSGDSDNSSSGYNDFYGESEGTVSADGESETESSGSDGDGAGNQDTLSSNTPLEETNSGSNTSDSKKNVTLNVWIMSANQPEFFAWVKQQFEKQYPNIKLKIQPQTQSNLGTSLDTTLSGKNGPDVVATWGGLVVPKLYTGKRILKLDDVVTSSVESSMIPVVKYNKQQTNNEWYCVPLSGFASPTVFYNKTVFKANGWEEPKTYDELVSLAKKIRDKGKQPIISGFNGWQLPHFMQAIAARTMSAASFDNLFKLSASSNPFSDKGIEDAFELLEKYQTDNIFANNITGYSATTAVSDFVNQTALMYMAPSQELLTLNDTCSFEIGAFLLPKSPVSEHSSYPSSMVSGAYSDVFVINSKTKYADEAKTLLKFLISEEAQTKLFDYYLFPVIKSAKSDKLDSTLKSIYNEILKSGLTGFYMNYSVPQLDSQLINLAQGVLSGSRTPAEAQKSLEQFYESNVN